MDLKTIGARIKTIDISNVSSPVVSRDRSRAARRERLTVLERDNFQCVKCKEKGLSVLAEEVDHIIPIADGGSDTMNNKQSLCKPCHEAKTTKENRHR